jgi:hypothetical protein
MPSPTDIDEAVTARTALTNLWRLADPNRLDQLQRKSLSSFSLGTNEILLPPVLSNQVLSCITDPTDIASLVQTVNISGPSVRFLIDNQRISAGAGRPFRSSRLALASRSSGQDTTVRSRLHISARYSSMILTTDLFRVLRQERTRCPLCPSVKNRRRPLALFSPINVARYLREQASRSFICPQRRFLDGNGWVWISVE